MTWSRTGARTVLVGALATGLAFALAGCLTHRSPYRPPERFVEEVPGPSAEMPVRVEKIQVGRGGPVGYIRVDRRWLDRTERATYTTTWVYGPAHDPRGFFTEFGDTVRFTRRGREPLGRLDPIVALYALLSGRDRFAGEDTGVPEIIYLPMEPARTGLEREGEGAAASEAGDDAGGEAAR